MSDRAGDKMRGRLGRTAPVTRQVGEGSASAAGEAAAVRKVRITVDLPADEHRALRVLAAQEGVDGQRVMRACLAALRAGGPAADEILAILRTS